MKEHEEQVSLFNWANGCAAYGIYPELSLLFAIPNGQVALKMVKSSTIRFKFIGYMNNEGRKKGVPDMFLAVARGGYHGLFIELKRADGGVVSKEQREWINKLKNEGYLAVVCHGCQEAQETIEKYLKGES